MRHQKHELEPIWHLVDAVFNCNARHRPLPTLGSSLLAFHLPQSGLDTRVPPVPQIGRVVIGDDVEIGANTTVDRGALADTVIGEGTKIDNLVQIAHNVVIGRHCVIVAQSGIAGSAQLGDFVVMGAHSGVIGHVTVGSGAQVAGMAHVKNDVEAGARMGGTPARPFKDWAREVAALKQLGRRERKNDPE